MGTPVYIPTPVLRSPASFSATPVPPGGGEGVPGQGAAPPPPARPGLHRGGGALNGPRPPARRQHRIDTETAKPIAPQCFRQKIPINQAKNHPQTPLIGPAGSNCQPRARRVENQITRVFCPPQASLLPILAGYHLRLENKTARADSHLHGGDYRHGLSRQHWPLAILTTCTDLHR